MVASTEDTHATQRLLEMQARLARDPYQALGLTGSPSPADVRDAFLSLTKQFHPARFSRMAPDVQRLANEVFLALRAAHDTLARPAPKPRQSGAIPVVSTSRTTSMLPVHGTSPRQTGQTPIVRAPAPPPAQPPSTARFGPSPATQPGTPPARAATTQSMRPSPPEAVRPSRMPAASPPPQVRSQPRAPASAVPRPGASPYGGRVTPATTPGVTAPRAPTPARPGDREVAPVLALLEQGQFAASKLALETLATRSPGNPRYLALLAYAKGREAQLERRLDEARVELQEALQLDPSLDLAKVALAELFTRRK